MAIDSSTKRISSLIDPWGVLALPDGTIDSGDRLTLLGQYSGIPAQSTSSTPAPSPEGWHVQFSRLVGTSWKRIKFPTHWIESISPCETLEKGGYGQCTITVLLTWEQLQEVALSGGERVDVFIFGERIYRGFVRMPDMRIGGSREECIIESYGLMERTDTLRVECMYAFGDRQDLSAIAERIFDDHCTGTNRLQGVVKSIMPVGVTADRFDARGKSATEAWNALCDLAPNIATWSFSVNAAGQNVFYFGPRITSVINYFTVGGQPGGERNALSFAYPKDLRKVVNSVKLLGGKVSQPNLLSDGSFENPLPNSETNGNILEDYSFENGSGGATLSGGASRKGPGDHGGGRTGSYWSELDTNGEKATWPDVAIDSNVPLVASFWARRESAADPCGVRMHVQGLDAGSSVVIGFYVPSSGVYHDPGSETYVRYSESVDFTPYPTVTQVRVSVETNGGTALDDGVNVDDVALYEKTASPGAWTYGLGGAAKRAQLEWQQHTLPAVDAEPYHGCYAVKAQAAGALDDTDNLEVKTASVARPQVRPNNPYTFAISYRTEDGSSTFPNLKPFIREYKADGTLITTTYGATVTAASAIWSLLSVTAQTDAETATVEVGVRFMNDVVVYLDAAFLCYGQAPTEILAGKGGYWEGETYERKIAVTSSYLSGLSIAAAASISTYGLQEDELSVESVVDWDTAQALLTEWFNSHAIPEVRGTLAAQPANVRELLTPAGKVRLLNLPDAPDPLSCVLVSYTISPDQGVGMDAQLGDLRPDMGRLQAVIEQRAKQGL